MLEVGLGKALLPPHPCPWAKSEGWRVSLGAVLGALVKLQGWAWLNAGRLRGPCPEPQVGPHLLPLLAARVGAGGRMVPGLEQQPRPGLLTVRRTFADLCGCSTCP